MQYLLNRNSDQKTLYIKIDQKNITNTDTISVCLPPPFNVPNIEPSPPVTLSVIFDADNGCPDRKTLYIKVAQNGSTITDTIPIPPPHPLTYCTQACSPL